jgi:hypothetical protein
MPFVVFNPDPHWLLEEADCSPPLSRAPASRDLRLSPFLFYGFFQNGSQVNLLQDEDSISQSIHSKFVAIFSASRLF